MKIVDLNLLLYAYHAAAKEYEAASVWLTGLFAGHETVALSWVTLLGFLRIATAPKILATPYDLGQATEIVSGWLVRSNVLIVSPTERHWAILAQLLAQTPGQRISNHGRAPCRSGHRTWRDALHQRSRLPPLSRPQSRVSTPIDPAQRPSRSFLTPLSTPCMDPLAPRARRAPSRLPLRPNQKRDRSGERQPVHWRNPEKKSVDQFLRGPHSNQPQKAPMTAICRPSFSTSHRTFLALAPTATRTASSRPR